MSMKRTGRAVPFWLATLALGTTIWAAPAGAQSQTGTTPPQTTTTTPTQDDITRSEIVTMDGFLDSHPEIAQQLEKNPELVNNKQYVQDHPALQQFLGNHPELTTALRSNPYAFKRDEQRYERSEDQINRSEVAAMDDFLDNHHEIAEQLKKDPSLIDNKRFVTDHPALQQFLTSHPEVRQAFDEHPDTFMKDAEQFAHRQDRITRSDVVTMDGFLDSHPEIAEQLEKNPELVNNKKWVDSHPALQQFLGSHPELTAALDNNPYAFKRDEQRYEQHENGGPSPRSVDPPREVASFHDFLGSHDGISGELSKNPSLATNDEYLANHPELRDYLKSNPQVSAQLQQSPDTFVKSAQALDAQKTAPKLPAEPKMK